MSSRSLCPEPPATLLVQAVSPCHLPVCSLQCFVSAGECRSPSGLRTPSWDKARHSPGLEHWFPSRMLAVLAEGSRCWVQVSPAAPSAGCAAVCKEPPGRHLILCQKCRAKRSLSSVAAPSYDVTLLPSGGWHLRLQCDHVKGR